MSEARKKSKREPKLPEVKKLVEDATEYATQDEAKLPEVQKSLRLAESNAIRVTESRRDTYQKRVEAYEAQSKLKDACEGMRLAEAETLFQELLQVSASADLLLGLATGHHGRAQESSNELTDLYRALTTLAEAAPSLSPFLQDKTKIVVEGREAMSNIMLRCEREWVRIEQYVIDVNQCAIMGKPRLMTMRLRQAEAEAEAIGSQCPEDDDPFST
eukprot:gb/GEZN01018650.1/.p1 GENE.gb/GEZN01018650.1/~~gb/GEZN01018650.1/.p1  ORF type:complete len:224 (+),score=26.53 gb/GEZN01018650.1/:26-673(+)